MRSTGAATSSAATACAATTAASTSSAPLIGKCGPIGSPVAGLAARKLPVAAPLRCHRPPSRISAVVVGLEWFVSFIAAPSVTGMQGLRTVRQRPTRKVMRMQHWMPHPQRRTHRSTRRYGACREFVEAASCAHPQAQHAMAASLHHHDSLGAVAMAWSITFNAASRSAPATTSRGARTCSLPMPTFACTNLISCTKVGTVSRRSSGRNQW